MTDDLMTIDETVEYLHGVFNKNALAQMRFKGEGPKFLKPTPRTVLYRRSVVDEWLNASERTITGVAA